MEDTTQKRLRGFISELKFGGWDPWNEAKSDEFENLKHKTPLTFIVRWDEASWYEFRAERGEIFGLLKAKGALFLRGLVDSDASKCAEKDSFLLWALIQHMFISYQSPDQLQRSWISYLVSFGPLKTFAVPRDPSVQVDMTLKALKTEFKPNVTPGLI